MTALASGAALEVTPTALDDRGAGTAVVDDVRLHVAGALPGERVAAVVEHVSPHRRGGLGDAWGHLRQVLQPAPEREPPACPAYGACGGCSMQHLAYQAQLGWKRGLVEQALAAAGLGGARVEPCVPSPRRLGYRNQAKYVWGEAEGRLVLGGYAPRSHRIVDLDGCRVIEPVLDETARALREVLAAAGVPPFDERRRTGLLRHVALRSNARGQVLAALVTGRRVWPEGAAVAAAARAAAPALVGVVQNVNEGAGNAVFGAEDITLAGDGALDETITWSAPGSTSAVAAARVRLGPRAFLQLNREVAAAAYGRVRAAAATLAPLGRVVDVFAGVGAVAFTLADLAGEVIAVEDNAAATAAGAQAAAGAGLGHVRFVTADAARGLAAIDAADLVVLNPPRAGVGALGCAAALRLRPRALVYLSCNPVSLARDLQALAAGGLTLDRLTPLDMLPHTGHVETLALLR